jgi:serine/threonine protein kinase/predicted negative regulator of RcsB-dependent stress response
MNPQQWARVKDIFNAALERDAAARGAYVSEASGGDDVVRAEVERLLDAEHQSGGFMEQPASTAVLSGRVIGHYELGRLIGSGGMGHVYAARDVELGREVALKMASLDGQDAQSRLRREAQHASRLSHPNICHIYDVGRVDGQMYVVMELLPGQSLADLLRDGPLSIAHARRYGLEIADALAHAHEHGVTHRDLKSTNVMITPKRGAKVLDFGLARTIDTNQIDALSHSQRSLTAEGMIAGTLPYMAPELLRGQRGDQRADIWALGVLLYEMVTGRRPFGGATGFELSAAILHEPPQALPAAVPAPMRAIIQRCLEKNPADRYQHATDVQEALNAVEAPIESMSVRVPFVPRRLLKSVPLLIIGLAIAGVAWYALRTPVVSNALGYSFLEAGEFDRAVKQFQAMADRSPKEANAWDSLGEGYLANGMPDKALDAYSRSLAIEPNFEASVRGRGLALAALGRYDEALARESPDFRIHAFLLSRVGRYREAAEALDKGRREDDDGEIQAGALVTLAWLLIEQQQYAAALEAVRGAEKALADRRTHSLLVLGDLVAGIAEIRAGNVANAFARLDSQKSRHDGEDAVESNWIAALDGEIALAEGQYDRALASFNAAQKPAWITFGRDASTVFGMNLPSRDGPARVEIARANRSAAIQEYRRLTTVGPETRSSAVLEPRYILALSRLLSEQGDQIGARVERERFRKLWAHADAGLPELR